MVLLALIFITLQPAVRELRNRQERNTGEYFEQFESAKFETLYNNLWLKARAGGEGGRNKV